MEPRDELEMLRKRKRLAELEAKAAGTPAAAPVETPAAGGAGPAAPRKPLLPGINQPADIPGVGLLINSGEAVWNAAAKAASGYTGLLGTVLPGPEGQGADWQRRTNETLRTDFTPNADPLVHPVQAVANANAGVQDLLGNEQGAAQMREAPGRVMSAIDESAPGRAVNNWVETTPGVKEGIEGAMDISALIGAGQPLSAARAPVSASRRAIADSEKLLGNRKGAPVPGEAVPGPGDKPYLNTPIAEASRAGINVTPWEVEQGIPGNPASVTGSTRAGFGTGAVNKETAMGNAPRINELGIRGMPEGITIDPRTGRIEPNVIEGAKNVERAKYDAVRQVPGDGTSLELQRELGGLARGLEAVPDTVRNDVTRIIRTHAAGGPSTKLVDDIMMLRQEATMNGKRAFQQNDPTARQLAGYQRQVADVLQEELARRGDSAGLVGVRETLQEARVNFAKISTLEEALDDGFIDAARLERVTEGGGYLSDGLEDVSRFNRSASVSMTHPKRITQAIEPNFRAGATPVDVAARSAQFIGGNWLTKQIGRGGVSAINDELRAFRVPEQPGPARAAPFEFDRAPEPMGPPFPTGAQSHVPPAPPSSVPPGVQPFDRLSDRLAPDFNPAVLEPGTGAPRDAAISSFLADTSPDVIPWQDPGKVKPVSPAGQGSISGDLGPVSDMPAFNEGIPGRGPDLPDDVNRLPMMNEQGTPPAFPESGVVTVTPTEHMVYHNGRAEGPFTTRETADGALAYMQENSPAVSDTLAWPKEQPAQLPPDLQVGDQPPPRTPKFGPDDEFPAAPVEPQGPPPAPGGAPVGVAEPEFMRGGNVSDTLGGDYGDWLTKDGVPLRLYHGTTGDFDMPVPGGNNPKLSGPGIWMTDDPTNIHAAHNIGGFGGQFKEGANVRPLHAKMKNPLRVTPDNMAQLQEQFGRGFPKILSEEGRDALREAGYDGVITAATDEIPAEYMVLDKGNVASAIGGESFADARTPAISDTLSLEPDNGPPRSRVDVTEDLPSQGSKLHPHAYKLPGATRIETPEGYIDYIDNGDSWQIKHTGTRQDLEGQGLAQQREVDMANKAQEAGVTLNSDNEVNAAARRVYEKLIAKGKITADGPFDDGGPVYRNIRPAGGNVSDTLSPKAERSPVKFESRKRTGMQTFDAPRKPPAGENVSDTLTPERPDIIGEDPTLPPQWRAQAKKVADEDAAYEATQKATGDAQRSIVDLAKRVDAGDDTAVGALLDAIDSSPSQYLDTVRTKAKLLREGGAGKDLVGDLLKAIDYDIGLE